MYIIQGIRRNVDGKPDYVWTYKHANGRVCAFETESLANMAMSNLVDASNGIYGLKILFIPDK
jgi:hypothetical protein